MSFMQPEITEKMRGLMVDGNCGTDYIPSDVVDLDLAIGQIVTKDDPGFDDHCLSVKDYTENTTIYSIEVVYGHFGRYSAPGYMDCTPWGFDTDLDRLEADLDEYYGDPECDDCGNPIDECTCDGLGGDE